jgi:prophage regulatory protein
MPVPVSQNSTIDRLPAVKAKTGWSRSSIYSLIAQGKFPAQIKLGGGRAVGWLSTEIDEWIASRVRASRGGAQ